MIDFVFGEQLLIRIIGLIGKTFTEFFNEGDLWIGSFTSLPLDFLWYQS